MSEDIRSTHQGTLDKYIGDAVMAFWGAPVHFDDHAGRAVATALLMQASAARLNEEFLARGWPALKIGIGVNSGMMHVGDMGSKIRRAYTVMGDATYREAPEFAYRELDLVKVKGKNEPVAIYQPLGLAAELSAAQRAALASWQTALAWVRAQDWDGAEALLHKLQADAPGDELYILYLERIAYFRVHAPGPDWDGVTTYETK
jgi:adenylate cyclase